MPYDPQALGAEFDTFMTRAGLTVSAERRAQLLPAFAELREQVDLLRSPRTASAEPSNVFRLTKLGAA